MRIQFESYIKEHLDEAYRFAYIYTHSREATEDVVSDSIIKALNKIHRLKKSQYMKTWFYRIIINTAHTYTKKQNREVFIEDTRVAEHGILDDYSEINLKSLFTCLDPEARSIVAMRFFEDMKLSEIAEVTGLNENTVKTKLYGALNKLRKVWEE